MHADATHVKINYVGYLDDGEVFDDHRTGETLDVIIGRGAVMPPIMDALREMNVGDEAEVDVPFDQAYGDYDPRAIMIVQRSLIPEGDKLEEGQSIIWHSAQKPVPVAVKVIEAAKDYVRLDFNHPLAGKNLKYWVKVVDVA